MTPEDILAKPDLHITAQEITQVFAGGRWWFRDNRRKLYARGFPRPIKKGVWLRAAVREYAEREGRVRRPLPVGGASS